MKNRKELKMDFNRFVMSLEKLDQKDKEILMNHYQMAIDCSEKDTKEVYERYIAEMTQAIIKRDKEILELSQ